MDIRLPPLCDAIVSDAIMAGRFNSKEEAVFKAFDLLTAFYGIGKATSQLQCDAMQKSTLLDEFLRYQKPTGFPLKDDRAAIYSLEDQ